MTAERTISGGPARPLPAPSVAHAFLATATRLGEEIALRDPARGVELSWSQLRAHVDAVAGGLAQLGVGAGDPVALLLTNRWEFFVCDLAAVVLGAVPFSVYHTSAPEQVAHVVGDAGARIAVTERALLDRLLEARADLPGLERAVAVDGDGGDLTLADLEATGRGFDSTASAARVAAEDLLTLIYTSGTTGPPKGVELTHRNLLSLIAAVEEILPLPDQGGRVISWLPAAHIAERGANYYLPVIRGLSITVCPDPREVIEMLPQAQPSWFFAVPRIWEKLKAAIEAQLAALPDGERATARQALDAAIQKVRLESAGEPVPPELADLVAAADARLFSRLRARLGLDRIAAVHAGAAPTPAPVLEFFHAIGVPVGELWGMSETCGLVTITRPDRPRIGRVGLPLPGLEVKLAADGELLVRGESVMPGYRNRPDQTAEAIDADGWLHTGDVGELDDDGHLRIVDRKKELIINAAGKNMSPANIEAALKTASPLIGHAVAIGDGRPYNVALIVLDPEVAAAFEADVHDTVTRAVERANSRLSRVEQIKRFAILDQEWQAGGDELTPTMKLKRKPIADKYAGQIEALYAHEEGSHGHR